MLRTDANLTLLYVLLPSQLPTYHSGPLTKYVRFFFCFLFIFHQCRIPKNVPLKSPVSSVLQNRNHSVVLYTTVMLATSNSTEVENCHSVRSGIFPGHNNRDYSFEIYPRTIGNSIKDTVSADCGNRFSTEPSPQPTVGVIRNPRPRI